VPRATAHSHIEPAGSAVMSIAGAGVPPITLRATTPSGQISSRCSTPGPSVRAETDNIWPGSTWSTAPGPRPSTVRSSHGPLVASVRPALIASWKAATDSWAPRRSASIESTRPRAASATSSRASTDRG
jgi:hypothetical protein